MTWGPSKGTEDLKKQLKVSIFMLSLIRSGESWENVIGQRVWAKGSPGETQQGRLVHVVLCVPAFRDKDAPHPPPHAEGLRTCFRGKSRSSPVRTCLPVFKFLLLAIVSMPRCYILRHCLLNPITSIQWEGMQPKGCFLTCGYKRSPSSNANKGVRDEARDGVYTCICRHKISGRN